MINKAKGKNPVEGRSLFLGTGKG